MNEVPIFDLRGKAALISGAGRGVGAGIASALAGQGAAVAVNDLDADRARSMAEALAAAGVRALAAPFDVSDRGSVEAGVAAAAAALGLMEVPGTSSRTGLGADIPVGRLGRPADVGSLCVYLASPEASWMTGQTIHLTGGHVTT